MKKGGFDGPTLAMLDDCIENCDNVRSFLQMPEGADVYERLGIDGRLVAAWRYTGEIPGYFVIEWHASPVLFMRRKRYPSAIPG